VSRRILLVDDDAYTRTLFEGLFRGKGVELHHAASLEAARRRFREADYNLILMDQRLPDGSGLDLLREMRRERPRQVAILITGFADIRDAVRAVREGLFDYLTKPFQDLEALEAQIEKALELDRAYREIGSLRESLAAQAAGPVLIGRSPAVERLLQQIRQVAPLDTTVLLEGESGTGKELAARLIHGLSPRSGRRIVDVNCGALSETLLESALFGYEKGAFTGAAKTTPGLFEEADGGTLFLDEIADMSPKLQASLLRVLQERRFARLGATTTRGTDFRLVCATNRRLADAVAAGAFRSDLYYRINVVALAIPPLRERREDIAPLALHFLDHFNAKFGKEVGPLTPEAIAVLESLSWPGNVRQLQHAMERIVALKPGGPVTAGDVEPAARNGAGATQGPAAPPLPLAYAEAREHFEREYLDRLMEAAGGNVSEAARLSGISRQNLYVRMNRLRIVAKS
jgi:two-component system response regulator HydG